MTCWTWFGAEHVPGRGGGERDKGHVWTYSMLDVMRICIIQSHLGNSCSLCRLLGRVHAKFFGQSLDAAGLDF